VRNKQKQHKTAADERYAYNLQIAQKERILDELYDEQKKAVDSMENFSATMMQHFDRLSALEEDRFVRSGVQNNFSDVTAQKEYFSNMLAKQEDEMRKIYSQTRSMLEDEREGLQRERDELVWD